MPGAHSKQGQKVLYSQCIPEKRQRKLCPKEAAWKEPRKQTKHLINDYGATHRACSKTQTRRKKISALHQAPGECFLADKTATDYQHKPAFSQERGRTEEQHGGVKQYKH